MCGVFSQDEKSETMICRTLLHLCGFVIIAVDRYLFQADKLIFHT